MGFSLSFLGENTKEKLDKIGLPDPGEVLRLDQGRKKADAVLAKPKEALAGLMKQGTGGADVAKMLHQGFGNNAVANMINKSPLQQVKGHIPTSIGGAIKQHNRRERAKELRGEPVVEEQPVEEQPVDETGTAEPTTEEQKAPNLDEPVVAEKAVAKKPPQPVAVKAEAKAEPVVEKQDAAEKKKKLKKAPKKKAENALMKPLLGQGVKLGAAALMKKKPQAEAALNNPLALLGQRKSRFQAFGAEMNASLGMRKQEAGLALGGMEAIAGGKSGMSGLPGGLPGMPKELAEAALAGAGGVERGMKAGVKGLGDTVDHGAHPVTSALSHLEDREQDATVDGERGSDHKALLGGEQNAVVSQEQNAVVEQQSIVRGEQDAVVNEPNLGGVDKLMMGGQDAVANLVGGADNPFMLGAQNAVAKVEEVGQQVEDGVQDAVSSLTQNIPGLPGEFADVMNRSVEATREGRKAGEMGLQDTLTKGAHPVKAALGHLQIDDKGVKAVPTPKTEDKGPWVGPDTAVADEKIETPPVANLPKLEAPKRETEGGGGDEKLAMPTAKSPEGSAEAVKGVADAKAGSPTGGAGIKADPKAKPRTSSELGKATNPGDKAKPRAAKKKAPALKTPAIGGGNLNINTPPELPDVATVEGKSKSGMTMTPRPVKLPQDKTPTRNGEKPVGPDGKPQKTQAQIAAEAEQVGKAGQAKLDVAEKDLQTEAQTEADVKKTAAEQERDQKTQTAKTEGDTKIAAKEAEGKAQRTAAEGKGEQMKTQAEAQGVQKETAAKAKGKEKEKTAKAAEKAKIATEKARQKTEIAAAKASTEAEEQKARAKGEGEKRQMEAEGRNKEQAARQEGTSKENAINTALTAEKASLKAEGERKAQTARTKGETDANAEMRRGQQKAQAERNRGLREKRRLERAAERKKADQSWYEKAWNAVKSAVSSLINRAKKAWSAAKALANKAISWARKKAAQIRAAARKAASAAYAWADKATGGAISRAKAKLQKAAAWVSDKVNKAKQWGSDKVNAIKEKVTTWVAEKWQAFKDTCSAIKNSVTSAINKAVNYCKKKYAEAKAWVNEKIQAAKKWVSDKINAAVDWVKKKYNEIATAIRTAVNVIVEAVKATVMAVWDFYANALKEIGAWLSEAWDKFASWAQEAFVKFWTGPWRDIIIGIAVAVLIAAVTVATGGAGLILIVGVSAAATGALRMGGEIAARRAAVSIKNGDPDRAARIAADMKKSGGDAQEWYDGVKKDEDWMTTIHRGGVEGARGLAEGAVSGLVGGAGGAIATKVAGGIAKAGAKEGAKFLAKKGVQKAAEYGTRVAIDASLGLAGDMASGTVNAELDVMLNLRTREEAYKRHVDRHLTPGALLARAGGSSITGGLRMGSHKGPHASVQDKLVGKIAGKGAQQATATAGQKIAYEVVDMGVDGIEGGTTAGLMSMANGGTFQEGFGKGFVGGVTGHAGRKAGEKWGRSSLKQSAPETDVKHRGDGDDGPDLTVKDDVDMTMGLPGGRTRVKADADAPVHNKRPTGDPDPATGAPSKVPKVDDVQVKQAEKLNRLLPGKVEGLGPNTKVVPDGTPGPHAPGTMTVTEAKRYMRTVSAMRKNPTGQEALTRIKNGEVEVTMERGVGSFSEGKRVNIDPEVRGRQNRAGVLAHETHHAATAKNLPDIDTTPKKQFVEALLRNEAEAQAKLFEYHRDQGTKAGRAEFGAKAYGDAYDAASTSFRKANPTATEAQVRAHAVEAGTAALQKKFGEGVPTTSTEVDPKTGRKVIKEGAPKTYEELYGRFHDENSAVGSKTSGNKGPRKAAPEVDGDGKLKPNVEDPELAAKRPPGADEDHPGVELHNHFLGLTDTDYFIKKVGGGDPDVTFAKIQEIWPPGSKQRAKLEADFPDTVRVMKDIEANPNMTPKQKKAALEKLLTATQETPFDNSYEVRDELIKEYIDPAPRNSKTGEIEIDPNTGKPVKAEYRQYTEDTMKVLSEDRIRYSEQSASVNKLLERFPEATMQEIHAKLRAEGHDVDMRFLAMVNTKYLSTDSGPDSFFKPDMDKLGNMLKTRGDVMGIDIAAPEKSRFTPEGMDNFEKLFYSLQEAADARGRPLTMRPHVGEGYPEMAPGQPFSRNKGVRTDDDPMMPKHYKVAQDNMDMLLTRLEKIAADNKGKLPDNVIVRFGHATHATPDQVARMKALGVVSEANIVSNVETGSLQRRGRKGQQGGSQSVYDDHSLLKLLYQQNKTILSTDAHGVMHTNLGNEYLKADGIIRRFKKGKVPVEVPDGQGGTKKLWWDDLSPEEKSRFDRKKLESDAYDYEAEVRRQDANDKANGPRNPQNLPDMGDGTKPKVAAPETDAGGAVKKPPKMAAPEVDTAPMSRVKMTPEQVAATPLRAHIDDLMQSPAGQQKLYAMAQEGLADLSPKLDGVVEALPGSYVAAQMKRTGQQEFIGAVQEKMARKSYPEVGRMGDMVRARLSVKSGADMKAAVAEIKARFPGAVIDYKEGQAYPRFHADIPLKNGITAELQIGTRATTRLLESPMVEVPASLASQMGTSKSTFHTARHDILHNIKNPALRAKYGVDSFETKFGRLMKESADGQFDMTTAKVLSAELTIMLQRMENDDPQLIHGLYTKGSKAQPLSVKQSAPEVDGAEKAVSKNALRMASPEVEGTSAPKPKVEKSPNPDAVTLHGEKPDQTTHKPTYKDVGKDIFKNGKPTLADVQQGYLGDCYLFAAMGAIVKQQPEVIQRMFVDHGDGTVSVTLHTMKNGYVVAPGTKGASEHVVRVSKDMPVADGKSRPTYGKGKDGQLWPCLVEKAYAVVKGKGSYDKIGHGGFTTDAMETMMGRKARSFSSSGKKDKKLVQELKQSLADKKPVAAGSINNNTIKNNKAIKTLATEKDVVANHAYVVDRVDENGMIHMHNIWGRRHPKPLTAAEFKKLYPNVYIGDRPPKVMPEVAAQKLEGQENKTGKRPAPETDMRTPGDLRAFIKDAGPLHTNIGTRDRIKVIKDVPLSEVMSAPGHEYLRNPKAVEGIAGDLKQQADNGAAMFKDSEPMILNVYTESTSGGGVRIKSVECLDGNHRFAGGMHSGKWRTIGDIPAELLQVRVNGFDTGGQQLPRWIPKHIAEGSSVGWHEVHGPMVKGPTAQIGGDISSSDPRFPKHLRGVRMGQVVEQSLARARKGPRMAAPEAEVDDNVVVGPKSDVDPNYLTATAARDRVASRLKAGAGLDSDIVDSWISTHGLGKATEMMGDHLLKQAGLDPHVALQMMKDDPQGFYEQYGAVLAASVLRKGMTQQQSDDAARKVSKVPGAALIEFADSVGFSLITHFAPEGRGANILGTGALIPGKHSGGLNWASEAYTTDKPTRAQSASFADYGRQATDALPIAIPKDLLIPPSKALETKNLPDWLNKKAYAVKGAMQSAIGKAAGMPPIAMEGPIHLLPKGMGLTAGEVDGLRHRIQGTINTKAGERAKLAFVIAAGSGVAARFIALYWPKSEDKEEKEEEKVKPGPG